MAPVPLSTRLQSFTPLLTVKLGPSSSGSRVGALVHTLGPCGSLQWMLLWGWEFLLNPHGCFQSEVWGFISPCWSPGLCSLFCSPAVPPFYLWVNVGPQGLPGITLWVLLAAAWPAPLHNSPPRWVRQPPPRRRESSLPRLPVSIPPTGLGECFFFISLLVGLPYSSIFCQFLLFFVFKLLLSFFWLCKEAQCVYYASILAGSFFLYF